jgi:hypothetical protein
MPVETRRAGEAITCDCGVTLIVPRLLELKKLEQVADRTIASTAPSSWGAGHGLAFAGTIVLLGAAALWILVLIFAPSDPYDSMTPDQIHTQFQNMQPVETWQWYLHFKETGINPHKGRIERYMESLSAQRQIILLLLGIAVAGGAALIGAGIFIARRKRPPRAAARPS